jgi:hypothetical protein
MSARHLWRATAFGILIMSAWLLGRHASTQQALRTQQIFMTAIEIKGSTTTDNLAPRRSTPLIYRKATALKAQVRQIRPAHSGGKSPATPSPQDSSPCRRETP